MRHRHAEVGELGPGLVTSAWDQRQRASALVAGAELFPGRQRSVEIGLITGERPSVLALVGVVLGLFAVTMLSSESEEARLISSPGPTRS